MFWNVIQKWGDNWMRKRVSLTLDECVIKDLDRFIIWYKMNYPDARINRSELVNSLLKYSVNDRDKLVIKRVYRDYMRSKNRVEYLTGFYSFNS